jgi:hypothetical protein
MVKVAYPLAGSIVKTPQDWSNMAQNWLPTGVIKGKLNDLSVYGDSTGMQVKCKSGQAFLQGHFFQSDAEVILPIATADTTNPRIDRIIIRLDYTSDSIDIVVLQGAPAVSPTAPALTQNSTRWEISLAKVQVNANVSTITAGNITDERIFTGIQSLNQTDTTQDFLANIAALGNGSHMFYAAGGVLNGPPSGKSIRGIAFTTGVGFTFIWCTDYTNTLFTNYCNGGTWTGWQELGTDQSTAWSSLTLQNAWVNEGSGNFANASYRINKNGNLELKGRIKNGTTTTGTIIATLPAGFRPTKNTGLPVVCHNGTNMVAGEVDVNADGTITAVAVNNYYVSLDGISIPLS